MAKIYLDAGHGGSDPGAVAFGRRESDDVLRLANKIKTLLQEQGISVSMTRTTDIKKTINERTAAANSWGANYFISIHRNSYTSESAKGAEVWVYSKTSADTIKKAQRIQDELVKVGFADRKVKKGAPSYTDFGVNKNTVMPACLVEVGFISNEGDNALFDSKFDALAVGMAKALCANVGVTYKEPKPEPRPTETFKKDDIVTFKPNAIFDTGKPVPAWAYNKHWIVRSVKGTRVVVGQSTDKNNDINSGVHEKHLNKLNTVSPKPETPTANIKEGNKEEPEKDREEKPKQDPIETFLDKLRTLLKEIFKR